MVTFEKYREAVLSFFIVVFLMVPGGDVLAGQCGQVVYLQPALEDLPVLMDDADRSSLLRAVSGSIEYLASSRQEPDIRVGERPLTRAWLRATLDEFMEIAVRHQDHFRFIEAVLEGFDLYAVGQESGDAAADMLITGYFEPQLPGSLQADGQFRYPLYRKPADLVESTRGRPGKRRVWRRLGSYLYTYPARQQIEDEMVLSGSELVYLADPVDAFVLHIQGSGLVRLQDGTLRRARYAGNNGHRYSSIGRLLVDEGKMTLDEVDMPAIIDYLHNHPEERRRILHSNQRYIFFEWDGNMVAPGVGPPGSLGVPVTAGRSVALDQDCYPGGVLGFLETEQPRFNRAGRLASRVSLRRFVLGQDSGAAIKGPERLDFFWGRGAYAEKAAGIMKDAGRFFVLLKKNYHP